MRCEGPLRGGRDRAAVEHHDGLTLRQKSFRDVEADKARATQNQDRHLSFSAHLLIYPDDPNAGGGIAKNFQRHRTLRGGALV